MWLLDICEEIKATKKNKTKTYLIDSVSEFVEGLLGIGTETGQQAAMLENESGIGIAVTVAVGVVGCGGTFGFLAASRIHVESASTG